MSKRKCSRVSNVKVGIRLGRISVNIYIKHIYLKRNYDINLCTLKLNCYIM